MNTANLELRQQVLETVSTLPEITGAQVESYFPGESHNTIRHLLRTMTRQGTLICTISPVKREGKTGRAPHLYSVNPDPQPVQPVMKLVEPTLAGLQARNETLKDQVKELTAWKDAAIAKFPCLGVAPEVILAREAIARIFYAGDRSKADLALSGGFDKAPVMQLALAMLEAA